MKGFRQKISKPMVHEHQKDAVGEPLFWQLHLMSRDNLDENGGGAQNVKRRPVAGL